MMLPGCGCLDSEENFWILDGWSDGRVYKCTKGSQDWVKHGSLFGQYGGDFPCLACVGSSLYAFGSKAGTERGVFKLDITNWNGQWQRVASTEVDHISARCTVVDGKVYVVGGRFNGVTECFDPRTNTCTRVADTLGKNIHGASICTFNGKIYMAGGQQDNENLTTMRCYDPATNAWSPLAKMSVVRANCALVQYGDALLSLGGACGHNQFLNTVEQYDIKSDTWQIRADLQMPVAPWVHCAMAYGAAPSARLPTQPKQEAAGPAPAAHAMSVQKFITMIDTGSRLPVPTQNVIKLVTDVKLMEQTLKDYDLDTDKLPLSKIDRQRVETGMKVLLETEQILQDVADPAQLSSYQVGASLACSKQFYEAFPSLATGAVPTINSSVALIAKVEMMQAISDMVDVVECLKAMAKDNAVHIDEVYQSLGCKIEPVDPYSPECKLIEAYACAQLSRPWTLQLKGILRVSRPSEVQSFAPFSQSPNRVLLWHGSRIGNWMSILKNGLRLDPPQGAKISGKMLGYGLYFADYVAKSAQYSCDGGFKGHNGGSVGRVCPIVLTLCEVALGDQAVMTGYSDSTHGQWQAAPDGKATVLGVGKRVADPSGTQILPGSANVSVPSPNQVEHAGPFYLRRLRQSGKFAPLEHNEMVIYEAGRARVRYVVMFDLVHST
eukprot:TRINITY_DN2447_c0_g1_i4.p1 TRINITY_DN2447_c0_g1~~TRINITY_DN2447_c0_g1_i4.p1  ORF type:complete len:665 (-),score=89.16 TRINITY_DN2447_c0_g1_i4:160-2154(-)